jgi:hypothetical protein
LGFGEDKQVKGATVYDKAKEKAGFVAGKHIKRKEGDWWFLRSKKSWYEEANDTTTPTSTSTSSASSGGDGGGGKTDK